MELLDENRRVLCLRAPIFSAQAAITPAATPMIDNNGATTDEQKIESLKLDPASGMPLPNLKPSKPSHFNPPGQSNALSPRQRTAKPSNARPF
ncbi:hypothetical protein SV7mr_29430 [Stieleria bergensis]|uniref:Uncharacterized protein n=1 Tax=Stieleria bergensis TaxID=2528025 RepID=A0A517SWH4_9BACT|nr:hypothetical protein SV7mr_29430 [Planctomycetes bacterium SV_7m_r]